MPTPLWVSLALYTLPFSDSLASSRSWLIVIPILFIFTIWLLPLGHGLGLNYVTSFHPQAFTMTFLAEWGDRSQITTIILGSREVCTLHQLYVTPTVRYTNCTLHQLYVTPTVRYTNCMLHQLYVTLTVCYTNCTLHQLYVTPTVRYTNCTLH